MPESTLSASSPASAGLQQLWRRHRQLTRAYRADSAQLTRLRRELGLQLTALRAQLAAAGPEGKFHAWLRAHQLPRATAYRLIVFARQPPAPARPGRPATAALPCIELRGPDLTLPLSPRQTHLVRAALQFHANAGSQTTDLPHLIARAFLSGADGFLRQQLESIARRRDLTADRVAALPPISIPAAAGN